MSFASKTLDSFQNFAARLGFGTGNQNDAAGYGFDFLSRNRVKLEAMYRSSWIVGQAVDLVAEDMTRAGVMITGDIPPDDISTLNKAIQHLSVWDALCDNIKWGRLYGGSIAVMLIDGQKIDTPLNTDRIAQGQFKGLLVLDRWQVMPSLTDLVTDYGPDLGMPKYYDVVTQAAGLSNQKIHYSRVIRIDGVTLPYWQRIAENLWGQSVIERLLDRLVAFDSATTGAAQLVHKAHLRIYKLEKFRETIASGGKAFEAMIQSIQYIRQFQSNEGLTVIDAKDQFESQQYSFTGLGDLMLQFGQQLSGALQIPLVRLFGQSPAGLNSTGESDLRMYYDGIQTQQERRLRTPLDHLFKVLSWSVLGKPLPDDFGFEFTPLWQMTPDQRVTFVQGTTSSVLLAHESGLISDKVALQELKQMSHQTGVFTNVTDDLIESADDQIDPPAPELEPNPDDPNDTTKPKDENEGKDQPSASA